LEPSIDFSQWGMTLIHKDDFKLVYSQGNSKSRYILYNLYPGIQIILTQLEKNIIGIEINILFLITSK
jgi:hypothetical protein